MTTVTEVNGISIQGIGDMVGLVKSQPAVAQATFSASTTWKTGFYSTAAVKDFVLGGARNDLSRSRPFEIDSDHPVELLGANRGPTSVEVLLAALGHCLAAGWATYGATMNITVDALRVDVEGDIDLQGMLALPEPGAVPPGYQAIRATYYARSSAPREQLEALAKTSEDLSPTRHSLRAVPFSSRLVVE